MTKRTKNENGATKHIAETARSSAHEPSTPHSAERAALVAQLDTAMDRVLGGPATARLNYRDNLTDAPIGTILAFVLSGDVLTEGSTLVEKALEQIADEIEFLESAVDQDDAPDGSALYRILRNNRSRIHAIVELARRERAEIRRAVEGAST